MPVSPFAEERDGGGRAESGSWFPWSDEPEEEAGRERRRRARQRRERREALHFGRYLLICVAAAAIVLFALSKHGVFTSSFSTRQGTGSQSIVPRARRIVLPGGTLVAGGVGTGVQMLQLALRAAGVLTGPADGVFGAETAAAVETFQRKAGLRVTGEYGPATKDALQRTLRSG
jgi:hypothetical protein